MPSICAPRETRKRQRSWMCGSQAALPRTVSPSARTAAMIAFSVPITDASSRYMRVPRRPFDGELEDAVDRDVGSERRKRVHVRVESPAADHVAAGRWHDDAPEARQQRAGEQERSANLARELGVEVGLARPPRHPRGRRSGRSTRRRRRGRREARPSSRRRGCAGRSRAAPLRKRARTPRGSGARRSCCPTRARFRSGDGRLR